VTASSPAARPSPATPTSREGALRLAHVVTLVTPTGAYGGPVRVATNQVTELRRRGHDATLWGGCAGFTSRPSTFDGVPAALDRAVVPGGGFAGTFAPGLLWRIWRHRRQVDCLHFHLARDLVTTPAAVLARVLRIPYVAQTHGMIIPKQGMVARIFDAIFTRPALRGARVVFHLNEMERQQLLAVSPGLPVQLLPNGVPVPDGGVARRPVRRPVEFLYLARLHPQKRPLVFVAAAARLLEEGLDARFALVGPDGGEEGAVRAAIACTGHEGRIRVEGALAPEHTTARMASADVHVLPSLIEAYPMSVLEALALGVPVILTESCGLAPAVREGNAGLVVDGSAADMMVAMRRLAEDPVLRETLGANAARLASRSFSLAAVVDRLCAVYRDATGRAA